MKSRTHVLNPKYSTPTSLPLYFYYVYQLLQESNSLNEYGPVSWDICILWYEIYPSINYVYSFCFVSEKINNDHMIVLCHFIYLPVWFLHLGKFLFINFCFILLGGGGVNANITEVDHWILGNLFYSWIFISINPEFVKWILHIRLAGWRCIS